MGPPSGRVLRSTAPIHALQSVASPLLDLLVRGITTLGSAWFLGPAVVVVYLAVDRRRGLLLAVAGLASAFLNVALKAWFHLPRPPRTLWRAPASGYGFPSGHSQAAATLWPLLARALRRRWVTGVAAALVVLVPLSRVYLGVHYPADVLAGTALGLALAGAAVLLESPAARWVAGLPPNVALALAFLWPLALLPAAPDRVARWYVGGLMGLGSGYLLEGRVLEGARPTGLGVLAAGAAGALLVGVPLGILAPAWPALQVATGLVTAWVVALGAPWAWTRLAESEP